MLAESEMDWKIGEVPDGAAKMVILVKNIWQIAFKIGRAFLSRKVSPEIIEQRYVDCVTCDAEDSKGRRLFRVENHGRPTCGTPRWTDLHKKRDEQKDGCGCFLRMKWGAAKETCPKGKW